MTDRYGGAVPGVSPRRAHTLVAGLALALGGTLPSEAPLADTLIAGSSTPDAVPTRHRPGSGQPAAASSTLAAGRHAVNLSVNGQRRGRVDVTFDRDAALCFNRALLDAGNLQEPENDDAATCHRFTERYPQTVIEQDPASLSLALVVPTEALRPARQDITGYQTGGFAGLLNYDLTGL